MRVEIAIIDGPLDPAARLDHKNGPGEGESGARLVFEGIARRDEGGQPIVALEYEAYEPMASRELERLARGVCAEFELMGLSCVHSRGRVPVGQASLRVEIVSRHRGEGLRAMAAFIDRLKQDVPIWKKPVYEGAERG